MDAIDVPGMIQVRMLQAGLSKRERVVLGLYLEGDNGPVIGVKLGISPKTADVHLHNLKSKLRAGGLGIGRRLVLRGAAEDGGKGVPEEAKEEEGGADHGC